MASRGLKSRRAAKTVNGRGKRNDSNGTRTGLSLSNLRSLRPNVVAVKKISSVARLRSNVGTTKDRRKNNSGVKPKTSRTRPPVSSRNSNELSSGDNGSSNARLRNNSGARGISSDRMKSKDASWMSSDAMLRLSGETKTSKTADDSTRNVRLKSNSEMPSCSDAIRLRKTGDDSIRSVRL